MDVKLAGDLGDSLESFCLAGIPAIGVRTADSERVEEVALRVFHTKLATPDVDFPHAHFYSWTATRGVREFRDGEWHVERPPGRAGSDFLEPMRLMASAQEPSIMVIHHHRLYSEERDAQAVLDAIRAANLSGSSMIFAGVVVPFPPEVGNHVVVIDDPLPSRKDIAEILNRLLERRADIRLPKNKAKKEALFAESVEAALGLTRLAATNAIALSLTMEGTLDPGIIYDFKETEVSKSDVLSIAHPAGDVGGMGQLKDWLELRKACLTDKGRRFGLSPTKGFLVIGPPGTGKSLVCKSLGKIFGWTVLRMDLSAVYRSYVGESEAAMRLALKTAEAIAPVILWVDEINLVMTSGGELDGGASARVLATLLTWRQETKAPVMLAMTSNSVVGLNPAIYRKERIDEVWYVGLPNMEERTEILSIHLKEVRRDPEKFDLQLIARESDGFTGAEIKQAVQDGLLMAFKEKKDLSTKEVMRGIAATTPASVRDREEVERVTEWAEAHGARSVSYVESTSNSPEPTRGIRVAKNKTNKKQ